MKKNFTIHLSLLFLLFANPFSVRAQQKNSQPLTDTEFSKAKQMYVDMVKTDIYKKSKTAQSDLFEKLPEVEDMDIFKTDEKFLAFVRKNLSSSKFKTVDEAMAAFKNSLELKQKLIDQHKELYAYMRRATNKQYKEIIRPEFVF